MLLSLFLSSLLLLASPDPGVFPAVRRVAVVMPDDPGEGPPGAADPWKGVYWWKAFSDGRDAGPSDRSFNFLGRPAGEAIAAGFRRFAANGGGAR